MTIDTIFLTTNSLIYLFAIIYCVRAKVSSFVVFIICYYFFSSLGAIFLFNSANYVGLKRHISFYPLLYLAIMLYLSIRPILKIKQNNITGIFRPNEDTLQFLIIIIIILALPQSIKSLYSFNDALNYLMNEIQLENNSIYAKTSGGATNYWVVIAGLATFITPLIFMYYLTLPKKRLVYIVLLGFITFTFPLNDTASGARGPLVKFCLVMIMLYLFFMPFYSVKIKRFFFLFGLIIGVGVLFVFYLLTVRKFFYMDEESINFAYLGYFSQNFLNFDAYGLDANGIRYGTRTATMLTKLLMPSMPSTYIERVTYFKDMKMNEGNFSTFVGDFTLDYGPIISLLLFMLVSLWLNSRIRRIGRIPFNSLFIFYFLFNLFAGGLFLHPFCNLGGNLQIIFLIVLYVLFSRKPKFKINSIIWQE